MQFPHKLINYASLNLFSSPDYLDFLCGPFYHVPVANMLYWWRFKSSINEPCECDTSDPTYQGSDTSDPTY